MGEFVQNLIFSDFMIILIMGIGVLMISMWAFRLREIAGYMLGWLFSIFLIIVISTLFTSPETAVQAEAIAESPGLTLSVASLIIPSLIGFAGGYGFMLLVGGTSAENSRARRALTIAAVLTATLISGYVLLRMGQQVRALVAIFVLTFAIGALLHYIMGRRRVGIATNAPFTQQRYIPDNPQERGTDADDNEVPVVDLPPSVTDRLRAIRNRVRR